MLNQTETFKELLANNGYSLTRQRQIIFNYLLTKNQIETKQLIEDLASLIDKASIYRNIKLFEGLGIILRISNGFKSKLELSDIFTTHHHHLTCAKCGKVVNINPERLEKFLQTIAKENNFYPSSHQIEVQGLCAKCKTF